MSVQYRPDGTWSVSVGDVPGSTVVDTDTGIEIWLLYEVAAGLVTLMVTAPVELVVPMKVTELGAVSTHDPTA